MKVQELKEKEKKKQEEARLRLEWEEREKRRRETEIKDIQVGFNMSGMFIPDPDICPSRISDPGTNNSTKRGGEIFFSPTIFCSRKYTQDYGTDKFW
jgi:hypothetical protein